MTQHTPSVTIKNVRKAFGALTVIHDLSVGIAAGEFVVLVGPSGCGKSTLLRMVAGLESVTGGEILIGDRVINKLPPNQRDIAMVFQSYALYPHMTVMQNMGFSLRLRRWDRQLIGQRVQEAANILGLNDLLDRYPRQLSGGQRQRVAMGRAIVRDPQVFLFDEPLSNLDAKLRVQMRTEIKELHQRLKTTVIYVTHDQIEAMTMADKIVVMRDGHIEQVGKPLELYDNPASQFVAGFIGSPSMNFLRGRVVKDGVLAVQTSSGTLLPLPQGSVVEDGQSLVYGIRPEHFDIVSDDQPGAIPAQVVVVEPTGAETMLVARIDDQNVSAVFRERYTFSSGERISLRPRLDQIRLFGADGARL